MMKRIQLISQIPEVLSSHTVYILRTQGCKTVDVYYTNNNIDTLWQVINRFEKAKYLSLLMESYEELISSNDLIPLEVDYSLGDCPVCGASSDEQCSIPDPHRDGFGMELGSWVHRKRIEEA